MKNQERAKKIKETKAANKQKYASQTIKIDKDWSIIRFDELNWQIQRAKNKEPWDKWYYGSLQGALLALPAKVLHKDTQNTLQEVYRCYRGLVESIERAIRYLDRDKQA